MIARAVPFALFLLARAVSAQLGGEVTGYSPQTAGLAGAGLAGAASSVDAAVNPASLGFLLPENGRRSGGRFDAIGRLIWAPTSITTADGREYDLGGTFGGGPFLGWACRLGDDAFLGLSLLPTSGGSSAYDRATELNVATANNNGPPWIPARHVVRIETDLAQIGFQPAVAWRADRSLAFGLGASVRYTRIGVLSATDVGLDQLQGEVPGLGGLTWEDLFRQLAAAGGREIDSIQADIDATADAAVHAFLQAGLMFEPSEDARLSLWYRSPSTRRALDGEVEVDVTADVGPILDVYGLDGVTDFALRIPGVRFPQQLGAAWRQALSPRGRFFADLVWTDWSQTFDGWRATVSEPRGGDIGSMLADGTTEVDLGLDWKDSLRFSLGWEWDAFRRSVLPGPDGAPRALISGPLITWRTGVAWANNPVGGSPMAGLLPYNQLHLAGGLSFWGRGGGDWHLALVWALPQSWTSGRNSVLSDLDGDRYRQANLSLVAGYALTW
ncbi:MAG: hypothetical protein D6702_07670 [Planctomycetota bacterium]|nr:MAG: hypothetical protein D6702_07670 [Planctomycetota bacterium]